MTEEEVQAVHEDMVHAEKAVGLAIKRVQREIGAEELLLAQADGRMEAELTDRMGKIKAAVLAGRDEVNAEMQDEINAVTEEAQHRIRAILNNAELTDAEKKQAIEQIDKFTM